MIRRRAMTDQPVGKGLTLPFTVPVFLSLASGLILLVSSDMAVTPVMAAWALATANFAAAFWCMVRAQEAEPAHSMMLIFWGGGVRMLLMISTVAVVVLKKTVSIMPFCTALLTCFVFYLIVEVWVVYKRGLLQ